MIGYWVSSQSHRVSPQEFAHVLRDARLSKSTVTPPSSTWDLDLEWAQAVQLEDKKLRLASGEKVIGAKLGLTSLAKQQAMKIDRPVFGFITDAMQVDTKIDLDFYNQPRIEPELVIKTGKDIFKPIQLTQVAEYISAVAVGFELIDSRYPQYQFTFEDVIADNTSAAGFSIGPWQEYFGANLSNQLGYLEEGDIQLASGLLSELLGDPLKTIVALSEWLHLIGESLSAGSIVLAGAMTNAFSIRAGKKYRAGIEGLGFLDLEVD